MSGKFYEEFDFVQALVPTSGSAATTMTGTAFNAAGAERATFLCQVISSGSAATDFSVLESSTSGGSYSTAASGEAAIAQFAAPAAGAVKILDIPVNSSKPWMKIQVVVNGAALASAVAALGPTSLTKPVTQDYTVTRK
jgi:hypothetical protein